MNCFHRAPDIPRIRLPKTLQCDRARLDSTLRAG